MSWHGNEFIIIIIVLRKRAMETTMRWYANGRLQSKQEIKHNKKSGDGDVYNDIDWVRV